MTDTRTRQRGSKEIWRTAAYEQLISEGIDAVKIMPLAKHLNLTRTGFYWFFKDISELHASMVRSWESKNTDNLVDRCAADAFSISEGLFNLMDCWLDPTLFDARLDLAIRNWARVDVDVQQRVMLADTRRIKAVAEMFARHGFTHEQAEVRSLTVIYTQIGYISMQVSENSQERLERVQHYVELFAGIAPNPTDVANFMARYQ